jgi:GGDEF domain-containing protein
MDRRWPMSHSEASHLISIRKASNELDRLDEMVKAAKASYGNAVWSAAQYTVELEAHDTALFREHLERIRGEAERAASPEEWQSIQASFRGELRQHRDRSDEQLAHLKANMKAAADAMRAFADSIATSGADHQEDLQGTLNRLDGAARSDNLAEIRAAIAETKQEIIASIQRMLRSHQMVIAQLRDEIRLLHQQIETERRALFLDEATGVWNRHKLDLQLEALLEEDDPFCMLVVSIRNLKRLDQRHSPAAIEGGIKALLQRFSAMLGGDAMVGRWGEETFAAILKMEPATAISLSRDATQRLSGPYTVQEDGVSRSIVLQAVAGVIDRSPGADGPAFQQKLLQMYTALLNA